MDTTTATQMLREAMLQMEGMDADTVDRIIHNLSEQQAAEALGNLQGSQADQDALRQRLMADPALRNATCPAPTWGTKYDRFSIAATACAILENAATHAAVTVDALTAAMAANGDSMQSSIDLHGDDPRTDSFGTGNFYGYRCRVRDAVATATQERNRIQRIEKDAADDARWAAEGLTRCDRCGGAGGHHGWPGYTCYDCGGHGAT